MDHGKPEGGKWTYDGDNRKKYPKGKIPPSIAFPVKTSFHKEAEVYVKESFHHHYGELNDFVVYPIDYLSAEAWLEQFFCVSFP